MTAWFLIEVVRRKRHTSSTAKLSVNASATVAGWSVSQNVSMPALSSFSSMSWASGVNSGSDMAPSRACSIGTVEPNVVDQTGGAEAHGQDQQRRTLQGQRR